MNDNDIIKALECCKSRECPECSRLYNALSEECECRLDLMEKVYDLINRQQAEIERYKGVIKLLENDVLTAKNEAVKEFEKLVTRRLNCNTPRGAYLLNIMNEVKKEMTEQSVNYGSSKTEASE